MSRADRPASAGASKVLALVAAATTIATFVFAGLWLSARSAGDGSTDPKADEAISTVAEDFAVALTNFDGSTLDADLGRLVSLSAGEFRGQLDSFFSEETRAQLKEAQASSRGEIRSLYLQSADDRSASVFVVVDQTVANNRSPQPLADTLRMEIQLQPDGDAGWLVHHVLVLDAPSGTIGSGVPAGQGAASGGG